MLQIDPSHWGILPLQYVADSWLASAIECHWWHIFKKWACNDVAPGISTDGAGSQPRGRLNQCVRTVLSSMKEAIPCLKFVLHDLRQLATQLSIPCTFSVAMSS